jgi:isopentenyldiphosphate isomerase
MQQETIEIVHEHSNEPTGVVLSRQEVIQNQHWARSTNVFVLNKHGDVLCHQRSLNKERYPGVWSTHFGGHVSHGETYEINAQKELEEEIGLSLDEKLIIPWRTTRINVSRLWVREFMTVYNGNLEDLKLQTEEIQQVKWFSPVEILNQYKENPDMFLAGTYDFRSEYQCLRAVLTACLAAGLFHEDFHDLHKWHPLVA